MTVSSTFFNAINAEPQVEPWGGSPLNWNCQEQTGLRTCFDHAKIAKDFFVRLLPLLEAHFENCTKDKLSSTTWICPSKDNSHDSLSLHVDPLTPYANIPALAFESKSKGSAKCFGVDYWDKDKNYRSFTCDASYPLKEPDGLLQFNVRVHDGAIFPNVLELDSKGDKVDAIGAGFSWLLDTTHHPEPVGKDSPSRFIQFAIESKKLQDWQNDKKTGLFQAFVAAIAPQAKEPPIPPSDDANTINDPQQNNPFRFALISGVIGTVLAVSAFLLSRSQKKQTRLLPKDVAPIS